MTENSNENNSSKILNAYRDKQFAISQQISEHNMGRYQVSSDAARLELHRYVVGGSAFGLLVLLTRFENSNVAGQGFIVIGLLFFLWSLFCAYRTMNSIWLEGLETKAD
jgi:hypothetical protein